MRRGPAILLLVLAPAMLSPARPAGAAVPAAIGSGAGTPAVRATGWAWPVHPVRVVHGFDLPAKRWLPGHRGVDLAGQAGSIVRAAGEGTVLFAGIVAGVPVVTVGHADGLRTTYEPVDADVRAGQWVDAGSRLGRLRTDEGHCLPAACLHWGLRRGEDYLDPLLLVAPSRVRLLPLERPLP